MKNKMLLISLFFLPFAAQAGERTCQLDLVSNMIVDAKWKLIDSFNENPKNVRFNCNRALGKISIDRERVNCALNGSAESNAEIEAQIEALLEKCDGLIEQASNK